MSWGHVNAKRAKARERLASLPRLIRNRKPRFKHRQRPGVKVTKKARISLRTGLLEAIEPRLAVSDVLDAEQARQFARILASGCSLDDVPHFLLPDVDPARARALVRTWAVSPLLVEAVNDFNHGAWPDLDKGDRLALTIDQSDAQMAHYVYTTRFDRLDGADLKKYMEARAALVSRVTGLNDRGDFLDAFHTFLHAVSTGKARLDLPKTIDVTPNRGGRLLLPETP